MARRAIRHSQFLALLVFVLFLFSSTAADSKFGIRRNVKHLSDEEKEEIKTALYRMKESPSRYNSSLSAYDYFPYLHAVQFRDYILSHRTWAFLPWHRAFQWLLEEELNFYMNRTDNDRFKIPYWNPNDAESTAATLEDTNFLGGDGDPDSDPPYLLPDEYAFGGEENWPVRPGFGTLAYGPSGQMNVSHYTYTSLSRWIGVGTYAPNGAVCSVELDHISLWERLFDLEEFDVEPYNNTHVNWTESHCQRSFRAQLEGCNADDFTACSVRHSTLHRYIGGHVADIFYSPNDPLFFMLHGYVDAMWAQWQDRHDKLNFPEHVLDDSLFQGAFNGNSMTARDVLDTENQLFYKYDIQEIGDEEEKEWYADFEKPWVYLLIVGVLVVVFGIVMVIQMKRKRNRKDLKQNIYEKVEDKRYGTNEMI